MNRVTRTGSGGQLGARRAAVEHTDAIYRRGRSAIYGHICRLDVVRLVNVDDC